MKRPFAVSVLTAGGQLFIRFLVAKSPADAKSCIRNRMQKAGLEVDYIVATRIPASYVKDKEYGITESYS